MIRRAEFRVERGQLSRPQRVPSRDEPVELAQRVAHRGRGLGRRLGVRALEQRHQRQQVAVDRRDRSLGGPATPSAATAAASATRSALADDSDDFLVEHSDGVAQRRVVGPVARRPEMVAQRARLGDDRGVAGDVIPERHGVRMLLRDHGRRGLHPRVHPDCKRL